MEATRIIAVRHGETSWNVDSRIQGQTDIDLNDTGRWQASRVGAALKGEKISAVYSSDLGRAHQTAQPIAEAAGIPVIPNEGLRERSFGIFEGKTFDEIHETWPDHAHNWRKRIPEWEPPEGGESLEVNSPRTWQLPNGAINRLLWTPQGFTLVGWSDTQHLDDEPTDENTSF